jgi:hypothetical protein
MLVNWRREHGRDVIGRHGWCEEDDGLRTMKLQNHGMEEEWTARFKREWRSRVRGGGMSCLCGLDIWSDGWGVLGLPRAHYCGGKALARRVRRVWDKGRWRFTSVALRGARHNHEQVHADLCCPSWCENAKSQFVSH